MFRNSLVSSSSLVRKAALTVIIGLTFAFIGVAAVYASSPKTYTGIVGGVSWSAFDSIDFAPHNGGWEYTGNSRTSATQPMTITVETTGKEYCGPFVMDTPWDISHTTGNAFSVSIGPVSSWAQAGQCSWFKPDPYSPYLPTQVENKGYHRVVNGSQSAEKSQTAWEILPN